MRQGDIVFLFLAAAVCDGLLGIAFLLFPYAAFDLFGVVRPNHPAYIQFPALLMITFSVMFCQIAASPQAYRILIPYGIFLKASFCLVAFGWWIAGNLPFFWKPLAVADTGFLFLFGWAYRTLEENNGSR